MRYVLPLLLVCVLGFGCGDDDSGGDSGTITTPEAGRDTGGDGMRLRPCVSALPVDMLWVIDNSNSMREEQETLAANFPVLIERLTNPPDANDDGAPDFPPLDDLRVGVVTTDLGVGDNNGVIGCDVGAGEEGRLVGTSRAEGACAGVSTGAEPWLTFDGSDPDGFSERFACMAQLGTDGCGLEQQLEASLLAITDRAEPGGSNAGFLRDDSLVVVVFVTDEDDCSVSDDRLFAPGPAAQAEFGSFGRRCAENPELLHPVSRYVSALRGLNLDRPTGIIVAAITGVPRDIGDPTAVDFEALLADPRMAYRPDEEDEGQLAPACQFSGVGSAVPARRIASVLSDFASTGDALLASICEPDLTPTLSAIADLVASRICDDPI